jgi:cobaltochelatase CobN
MRMLEQMMEYHARGYWNATDEQLQSIREAYLEIENELEGTI